MEKAIKATDIVRHFSEILNLVKFKKDRFIITRGKKPIAYLAPVDDVLRKKTLGELPAYLKELPGLENDIDQFLEDLHEIRKIQPSLPENQWE